MKQKDVTPSLLNVDEGKRLAMAKTLIAEGIRWIHYDVMDGKFVPNLAIPKYEIAQIRQEAPKHVMDLHLMIEDPIEHASEYFEIADITTLHYEALEDNDYFFNWLTEQSLTYNIGLAIKPETKPEAIEQYLPYLSLVLVMSVEPGEGGQKFIPGSLDKIKWLNEYRKDNNLNYLIQVDGGINDVTGEQALNAGADAVVAGTFLVVEPTKQRINSILGKFAKSK